MPQGLGLLRLRASGVSGLGDFEIYGLGFEGLRI